MKVLILHHHFNTPQKGGAIRSYYLAKALVDKGIETTVIATHNDKLERHANIEGINVQYLPIPYENKFGFYKRTLSFFRYVVYIMKHGSAFRNYDLCYTISVPLTIGLASLWIKKRYKIVRIGVNSAVVEDTEFKGNNKEQTLPLEAELPG